MSGLKKHGFIYLIEARNPYGDTDWNFTITESTMNSAKARGAGAIEELKRNVPWVVKNPTSIFRGVREEGENRWLCYAGRPPFQYNAYGRRVASSKQELLLVFVTEAQIVYTYRWEDADLDNFDLPDDSKNRFGKRLYCNDQPGIDG